MFLTYEKSAEFDQFAAIVEIKSNNINVIVIVI